MPATGRPRAQTGATSCSSPPARRALNDLGWQCRLDGLMSQSPSADRRAHLRSAIEGPSGYHAGAVSDILAGAGLRRSGPGDYGTLIPQRLAVGRPRPDRRSHSVWPSGLCPDPLSEPARWSGRRWYHSCSTIARGAPRPCSKRSTPAISDRRDASGLRGTRP